jgi:hypothetical protein
VTGEVFAGIGKSQYLIIPGRIPRVLEWLNRLLPGVMRHTQGIDPDSLHDTKGGAQIQMNASKKRMRLMARQFAEGGVRDLFLVVHDLLRSNATIADTIRLRNTWVQVDPSAWSRRKDVTIDIGIGSGGREEKLLKLNLFSDRIAQLVELQGGLKGPLVTAQNVYALVDMFAGALDIKSPERFVTDPSQQDPNAGGDEGPSPEMLKVQADAAANEQKLAFMREEAAAKLELRRQEAEAEMRLEERLALMRADLEQRLAMQKMQADFTLAREKQQLEAEVGIITGAQQATMTGYRPGGDLDK